MKECKACKQTKPYSDFSIRKDSKDGYRNICFSCRKTNVKIGKVIDETNKTYGKWTVLSRASNKPDGSARWNCKCECGTEKIIPANTLREGKSFSCGCAMKDYGKERRNLLSLENTILRSYKQGAKSRNLEFTITDDDIKTLIYDNCFYCGDIPSDKKYFYSYKEGKDEDYFIETNGIDRINNSIGYTKENTVACCKTCNQMKSNLSLDLFLTKINKIHNNLKKDQHEKNGDNTKD